MLWSRQRLYIMSARNFGTTKPKASYRMVQYEHPSAWNKNFLNRWQPVTHIRFTNSKPHPINSQWTKSSPSKNVLVREVFHSWKDYPNFFFMLTNFNNKGLHFKSLDLGLPQILWIISQQWRIPRQCSTPINAEILNINF